MAKFGKSPATSRAMKAREEHWLLCKERGLDIWETKLDQEEL